LQAVSWDDAGEKIWGPNWQDYVGGYATALAGITPRILPQVVGELDRFTARLRESDGADLTEEARAKHASATLSLALAVALRRHGWELGVSPGEEGVCARNGMVVRPFEVISRLASGELTADAWQDFCHGAGIADLALGAETTLPQEASSVEKTLNAAAC
jgi:hypothetical protein